MPKMDNLRRIRDSKTGLYLLKVAEAGRTWTTYSDVPKNNSWSPHGTIYKTSSLPRVLTDAAHAVACLEWIRQHGPVRWPKSDTWEQSREEFLARKKAMHEWASENSAIPDHWIIETVEVKPVADPDKDVPAKDWFYIPLGKRGHTLKTLYETKKTQNGWPRNTEGEEDAPSDL